MVKEELKETFELMESDICRIDDYEKFEQKFFTVLMDGIHPYFYDDKNISNIVIIINNCNNSVNYSTSNRNNK